MSTHVCGEWRGSYPPGSHKYYILPCNVMYLFKKTIYKLPCLEWYNMPLWAHICKIWNILACWAWRVMCVFPLDSLNSWVYFIFIIFLVLFSNASVVFLFVYHVVSCLCLVCQFFVIFVFHSLMTKVVINCSPSLN